GGFALNTAPDHKTIKKYMDFEFPSRSCLVIEDAPYYLEVGTGNQPLNTRDEARKLLLSLRVFTDPKQNSHTDRMIILLSESDLHLRELVGEVTHLHLGLPDKKTLTKSLAQAIHSLDMEKSDITGDPEKLVAAALGLTAIEAEMTFKSAAVENGKKLPDEAAKYIMERKKKIISRSGALEYIDEKIGREGVGGLNVLMDWLDNRKELWQERAKERNIPASKGVLFVGVPGAGKSLSAKVVAEIFERPLIRFDVAAVYGSYIGQTEQTLRQALDVAEAVAPCVLWIDEIEKALAGGKGGGGDSGVSTRVFGNLLTWMSEKKSDVFVVATANKLGQIAKDNPELLRKGRFDEIFFLDYPGPAARKKIFEIHLSNLAEHPETKEPMVDSIDIDSLDLDDLSKQTDNWTGSEIEQAVIVSLISAHNDGDRLLAQA
ncbi:uncharacterized protein METZ01_LOCUS269473, partial [marine metagenome]